MRTKYYIKNWILSLAAFCLIGFSTSCENDDTAGMPKIDYVRYTSASDAVSYANLGQTIAIIGQDLSSVQQVTFNGYSADFKTTMVSDTSIVVRVSTDTPFLGEEATQVVSVTTKGGTATATLEITPPAPEIISTSPEFAGEGGIVTIKGSYFYNISSVMFGDSIAEIINFEPYSVTAKVPEGFLKGNITVTSSKSGEGKSEFEFGLDDEEIILNWGDINPSAGAWWNSSQDGPDEEFETIGNSYKYVEGTFGSTWWTLDGGINIDAKDYRKGNPAAKVFKFEYALNGDSPWLQILWKSSLGEYKFIVKDLNPTNGKWATYSIPMNNFTLGDTGPNMTQKVFEADDPVLVQYAFVNSGVSEITIKCAATNFRIVEK